MKRLVAALATATALALAVSGCSNSLSNDSKATNDPKSSVDAKLAEKVPAKIKSAGTITIGTNPEYSPLEMLSTDGKTIEGLDVDLANAMFAKLGLKTKWESAQFETLINGVKGGKFPVSVSAFTIKPERVAEVNMVSYFTAGVRWATAPGNPKKFDYKDACGKSVAVSQGTYEETDLLPAMTKECADKGKPAINQLKFSSQDEAANGVASGRADAMVADSPVIEYAAKMAKGKIEMLGDTYDSAPYGVVLPKDQTEFAQVIADAFKAIKADGTYDEILKKWGITSGGVSTFEVNPKV